MVGMWVLDYETEKQGISLINRWEEKIFINLIAKQQMIEQYNVPY